MGKLMLVLVLVIALILRESFTQNVSKDKAKDKKSLELVMLTQSKNSNANEPDVNRLVVNSTYDDSIFISTYSQGVNVTIVQDHKDVVNVDEGENVDYVNREFSDELEPIDIINQEVDELIANKTISLRKARRRVIHLKIKIGSLQQKTESEEVLKRLQELTEKLISYQSQFEEATEQRLKTLMEDLEEGMKAPELRKEDVKTLDRKSTEAKQLALQLSDKSLRKTVLNFVKEVETFLSPYKFTLKRLVRSIRKALRSKYFTSNNASILEIFIAQLNEIVPTLKTNIGRNLVKSVKQEIGNLAEAITTVANIEEVLKFEASQFESILKDVPNLEKMLLNVMNNSKNEQMADKAKELSKDLDKKLQMIQIEDEIKKSNEAKNWMKVVDSINRTLNHPQGFGGKAGLKLIKDKLISISKAKTSPEVKDYVKSLLISVDSQQRRIDGVLDLFSEIDEGIKKPQSEKDVEKLDDLIQTVKNQTSSVNDPFITVKARDLIIKIQKTIETYKIDKQIDNINEVLKSMNQSLETAESSDELMKEGKKLNLVEQSLIKNAEAVKPQTLNNFITSVNSMRRSIPMKTKKFEVKKDAETLLKIVNGYLRDVVPSIEEKVKSVNESYAKLKTLNTNDMDIDALSDRIFIASNDLSRAVKGFKTVKKVLLNSTLEDREIESVIPFISLRDTTKELFHLDRLHDDPTTYAMLKKTFTITQNVKHANDTLKQLQQMIKFNTKLLTSGTANKTGTQLENPIKHSIVPIAKVSLFPPVNGTDDEKPGKTKVEKAATKATDLDKAVFTVSSKNRKGIKESTDAVAADGA